MCECMCLKMFYMLNKLIYCKIKIFIYINNIKINNIKINNIKINNIKINNIKINNINI